jgi:hypothetical protein
MLTEIHPDFWADVSQIRALTVRRMDRMEPSDPIRRIAVFFEDTENTLEFNADPRKVIEIINGIGRSHTLPRQTMAEVQAATDKTLDMLGFKSP